MGVELVDVGEDVRELLSRTVAEQVHRFTL
jgi:hypothetical protein